MYLLQDMLWELLVQLAQCHTESVISISYLSFVEGNKLSVVLKQFSMRTHLLKITLYQDLPNFTRL